MADYCARHMWNLSTQGPCLQCMDSNEKLAFVWAQMREARAICEPSHLSCPYCLSFVEFGGIPCCVTMGRALAAILEREDRMRVAMGAYGSN